MTNDEAIKEIKEIFDTYLAKVSKSEIKASAVPAEIHGYIADLLFRDHWHNDTLAGFIIGLLYSEDNNEAYIYRMLLSMRKALDNVKLSEH